MKLGHDENVHPGINTPAIWVIQVYEGVLDYFTPIYIFSVVFVNIKWLVCKRGKIYFVNWETKSVESAPMEMHAHASI